MATRVSGNEGPTGGLEMAGGGLDETEADRLSDEGVGTGVPPLAGGGTGEDQGGMTGRNRGDEFVGQGTADRGDFPAHDVDLGTPGDYGDLDPDLEPGYGENELDYGESEPQERGTPSPNHDTGSE